MQRVSEHAVRRAVSWRARTAVLAAVAAALLALPAFASAATLTVEKAGSGTGTVTSSPAGIIECGSTCSASIAEGTKIVLTGAPGANTAAVKWSGCSSETLEEQCVVTMGSAPKTVTATFNLQERPLKVVKAGAGAGTVTSSPAGVACGGTCTASFVKGTVVTLSATSNPGSEPVVWGGCESTPEGKCVVTMSAAKTVTATFELLTRQLTVKKAGKGTGTVTSSPAGINCGSTCNASFAHNSLVTLTGVAGAKSDPVQWAGCDSVDGENHCLVTMGAAREVTATFNLTERQLTVAKGGNGVGTVTSSPAGIACGGTCAASFLDGTSVTLTATLGLHTLAVKWTGCQSEPSENECKVTMSAAREVSAIFMLERQWTEYEVSVRPKGFGQGTVTSFPSGIECPGDCSGSYLFKTSLILLATPAPGSVFDHWSVTSCGGSTFCSLSVRSSRRITAVFTAVGKRTLTVAKGGSGQGTVSSKPAAIECGSTCSAEIDAPTKVVLKAKAVSGSRFKGWAGEGCSGTGPCRVTMNEARNVTATFERIAGPPPGPSEVFVSSAARVRGGKAMLRISCNGQSDCKGTLKLLLKIRNAQGQVKGLVVGTAPFNLAAGSVETLPVKLSQRARGILAETGRLKLRVVGATESHVLRLGQRP